MQVRNQSAANRKAGLIRGCLWDPRTGGCSQVGRPYWFAPGVPGCREKTSQFMKPTNGVGASRNIAPLLFWSCSRFHARAVEGQMLNKTNSAGVALGVPDTLFGVFVTNCLLVGAPVVVWLVRGERQRQPVL